MILPRLSSLSLLAIISLQFWANLPDRTNSWNPVSIAALRALLFTYF